MKPAISGSIPNLAGFAEHPRFAIVGATGGIGRALVGAAAQCRPDATIYAASRSGRLVPSAHHAVRLDYDDPASIVDAAGTIGHDGPLDLLIIATGLLHEGQDLQPEKDWRHLDAARLQRTFLVNTTGPALVMGAFMPLMARAGTPVMAALSARVGSISDNRLGGWYSYRASKAALNMIIKTVAIEAARKRLAAVCVGLHPGTVDTALSKPFQSGTRPGQVVQPDLSAKHLLAVVDRLEAGDSGRIFAWDGLEITP
ncbi:MAG: SDR family NAD(P)-dependent oxidoreductase [Hyphomicrobiaceae bacterium]